MVSIFGFKIGGGDKKKKLANEAEASATQLRRKHEQDAAVAKQNARAAPEGTVYAVSRPDTSHTCKITATRPGASPYGSKGGVAAMSMSELTDSIHPNLREWVSNPNIGANRFNASTSDLTAVPAVPPVPARNPSRPATPVQQKSTWMNPLDMNSTRGPSLAALSASKSPLDQFGLKLEIPDDESYVHRDDESPKALSPLRVTKSNPQIVESPRSCQSPQKPPSPPQSVKDMGSYSPIRGPPAFRDDMYRSSSRGSQRNVTTNLREVRNAWDMASYGPASIPSPVSTPRGSEETPTSNPMNLWCEPIIRSVAARRDTMASMTHHKVSLQVKLEDLEKAFMDEPEQMEPPQMSASQIRQLVRPPPLNLDPRPRTPDRAGTYPPSPFLRDRQPQTPTGETSRGATRDRAGPPQGAVGARVRPGRPNTKNVRRPAADEYVIQPSSQPQSRRASQDSSRPTSPDSPLLPQSGPLSSPRFLPIDSQLAPPPLRGARSNLHIETFALDDDEDEELIAPRMGHRNAPTPDSSQWPNTSPTESAFGGHLPYRAESPFARADSPLETPPRVLPQGIVGRSESPFGYRSFNFSRPMTPTLEQPPLRRDDTPPTGRVPLRYPPKRSETVPVSPGYRDYESSPSSPGRPPPRANTVAVNVGHGLRSPAIVGDDFGGGFI